jgi:hypothetical protein
MIIIHCGQLLDCMMGAINRQMFVNQLTYSFFVSDYMNPPTSITSLSHDQPFLHSLAQMPTQCLGVDVNTGNHFECTEDSFNSDSMHTFAAPLTASLPLYISKHISLIN